MSNTRIHPSLAVTALFCGALLLPGIARAQCEGQGNASLLMKGKCESGTVLKFRFAGISHGRYKLFTDLGAGPTEVPGVGIFCLSFGPDHATVASGRFNNRGLGVASGSVPGDPTLIGRTLAFQFASLDPEAPNGVAISNAYVMEICSEGDGAACPVCSGDDGSGGDGDDCDEDDGEDGLDIGILSMGFIAPVRYEGPFPATVTASVYDATDPSRIVGETVFDFDPASPPAFPIGDPSLVVTKTTGHPVAVIVHATVDASDFPGGQLPDQSVIEVTVGDTGVVRKIDTSCSVPIGIGFKFAPIFITEVETIPSADDDEDDEESGS